MKSGLFLALAVTVGLGFGAYRATTNGLSSVRVAQNAVQQERRKMDVAQMDLADARAQQEAEALRLERTRNFLELWRTQVVEANQVLVLRDQFLAIGRRLGIDMPLSDRKVEKITVEGRPLDVGTFPMTIESTLSRQLTLLGQLEEDLDLAGVLSVDFAPSQSRLVMSLNLGIPIIALPGSELEVSQ